MMSYLFIGVRKLDELCLGPRPTQNLKADWQILFNEAHGDHDDGHCVALPINVSEPCGVCPRSPLTLGGKVHTGNTKASTCAVSIAARSVSRYICSSLRPWTV